MHRFTFQIETAYSAKRPQDLDCVGLLERLRLTFGRKRATYARAFGRRAQILASFARA